MFKRDLVMNESIQPSADVSQTAQPAATITDTGLEKQSTSADNEKPSEGITREPIWPDYFARLGQPDAASWQYQGYWKDTFNVWRAYYTLVFGHPIVTFHGMRRFYTSLVYRTGTENMGKIAKPLFFILTPFLMLLTPFVSLLAVAIAPPLMKSIGIEFPAMFTPFKFMGWANYNVMLVTMFTLHSYKQHKMDWDPSMAIKHSSKIFWNDFFTENLPEGHRATIEYAVVTDGRINGEIPRDSFVIKPATGGGGNYLRTMTWDEEAGVYRCEDPEKPADEASSYTPEQLTKWINDTYHGGSRTRAVIEKLELAREPFPVSSVRVMTFNAKDDAELLSAVFLPAPEGSNSTAYFDLDTYLFNYEDSTLGQPIRPQSDGKYTGTPVPEMDGVIEACIAMHNKLPAHVEISWDVILTEDGPVYLEGNIMPPGCDYKLSVFKKWGNFQFLKKRLLEANL
jgi:Sugar-transfer associated ATP-grasp